MGELTARVAEVKARMERALSRSGRPAGSVALVAVSKTFPAEAVAEAARAGLGIFGENRVQEAEAKIPAVRRLLTGTLEDAPGSEALAGPSWHLVGHLQSNKAGAAVGLFDMVHSVDDEALARKIDLAAASSGKRQPILIQVNVSGEGTKSGVAPAGLRSLVDAVMERPHLELRGLMTIPPYDADPEAARRHFAALRKMGEKVGEWLRPAPYRAGLSMGMTEDFEVAIEEGATIVRVGRALFGERPA